MIYRSYDANSNSVSHICSASITNYMEQCNFNEHKAQLNQLMELAV